MRLQASQKNYNRFTLQLKDKSMHGPFWEFTIDEILFTMPYFIILGVTYTIASVFQSEHKSYMVISIVALLAYIAVYFLGNRHKQYHVYGMVFLYMIRLTMILVTQIFYTAYKDQIQFDLSLRASYQALALGSCFFSLCAVPTLKWLSMYTVIYIIAIVILSIIFGDFDNAMFNETIAQQPFNVLSSLVVFHIA